MADKDKIRFLTGDVKNLEQKTISRGQVYFAIDSTNDRGTILFDAPIDANTTRRIIMSGDHAALADESSIADKARKDVQGNMITETYIAQLRTDTSGLKLQYKIPDKPWGELSFSYLPLTGGHVTGVLQADSLTAGDLLVNGGARFVNKILGTIEKADQWSTERTFRIVDFDKVNLGTKTTKIDGSKSSYDLYLPETIKATLQGNASSASAVLDSGDNRTLTLAYSKAGLESATWIAAWNGNELRAMSPSKITAGKATALAEARKINGTEFDGSKDITTTSWGATRDIQIASSNGSGAGEAVSVNGSGNFILKLPKTITSDLKGNADTATKAKTLMNYYSSRQTSMNFDLKNLHAVFYTIASSSTTEAKPPADSTVLTVPWDSNGYGTQLAMSLHGTHIYIRGAENNNGSSVWDSSWTTVLDSSNYTNYTVKKDGTGASGTWYITADKAIKDKNSKDIDTNYLTNVFIKDNTNDLYKTVGTTGEAKYTTKIGTFAPLDANGLINIKYIPQAALERVVTVANKTARLALTTAQVQLGDVVRQDDTKQLYFVIDESKLNIEAGYMQFTAGRATEVPWSGIVSRPNVVGRSGSKDMITLDDSKTVFTYYRINSDGTNDTVNLAPAFLPLAGGHVTGVLQADSTTIGDLLVNGGARFVNKILGNIETADAWSTNRTFSIASSNNSNPGTGVAVNGSKDIRLLLPSTITASLIGHASQDLSLTAGGIVTGSTIFNTASNKTPLWITRMGYTAEGVSHGVDDGTYYITYNNDEVSSRILFTLNNTDTERAENKGTDASTNTVSFSSTKAGGSVVTATTFSGNATSASIWATNRTFTIGDNSNAHVGPGVAVNGSKDIRILLPATIKASIEGHSSLDLPLTGGTLTGNLNFAGTPVIQWNDGTWQQRIKVTDDSTANTNVFEFQQSSNSGSSFTTLMAIKDNGEVVATKFTGALNGNATSADKWSSKRNFKVSDHTNNHSGTPISRDGSETGDYNLLMPSYIDATTVRVKNNNLTTASGLITQIPSGETGGVLGSNGIAFTNPATRNDMGWIRVLGTSESDTVLELATGDDAGAGEKIVVRQYNTSNAVAREAVLMGVNGAASFPGTMTIAGVTNLNNALNVTGATVLKSTLTVAGATTINGATKVVNTLTVAKVATFDDSTDSANSVTTAAVTVTGGVSVKKQLSAKSIRVDNNQTNKGCTMKFNEKLNCVEFVFD